MRDYYYKQRAEKMLETDLDDLIKATGMTTSQAKQAIHQRAETQEQMINNMFEQWDKENIEYDKKDIDTRNAALKSAQILRAESQLKGQISIEEML